MYYIVKDGELVESATPGYNGDWALSHEGLGMIFPLDIYDIVKIDKNHIGIAGRRFNKKDLTLIPIEEVLEKLNIDKKDKVILKPSKDRFKVGDKYKYSKFTNAVIKCIMEIGDDSAITHKVHERKLSLIRDVTNTANKNVDISPQKAEELLGYFNLSLNDVLDSRWT